jgi:hypothetical protein
MLEARLCSRAWTAPSCECSRPRFGSAADDIGIAARPSAAAITAAPTTTQVGIVRLLEFICGRLRG